MILKKYLIIFKKQLNIYFFHTICTLQLSTTYKISFMCQKNIFSEDIFFLAACHPHSQFVTTTCHGNVTQKKNSPCCGHSCLFQNFLTFETVVDMLSICLHG